MMSEPHSVARVPNPTSSAPNRGALLRDEQEIVDVQAFAATR